MSQFTLKDPIGTNYRVDPNDLMNTKRALNQLGYYNIPAHRGIDDWTDDAMFDGIRRFQRDNGLKVDAFMRPGGPTENAINQRLQRTSFGSARRVDLGSMQNFTMCACTASDHNPHQDRPDPYE
ncbi:MAG: peptidoglycan-binding protein [Alphaproteobacteria bacterium]|nr:peptidoglycan-binding protein [Alphaproteobacteria bacterium]